MATTSNNNEINDITKPMLMYMHAGSGNHGCEAIVRGLSCVLDDRFTIISHKSSEDNYYGLNQICDVLSAKRVEDSFIPHAYFYAVKKLFHRGEPKMKYTYKEAGDFGSYKYAISIGGDNYCYENTIYDLKMANSMFNECGVKTALVGCSIEPELLEREGIISDMKKYSIIIARESITYTALRRALGYKTIDELEQGNTLLKLIPDPAFAMQVKNCNLPDGFACGHTIGINVSPLILGYEDTNSKGITLSNYEELIRTIIEETDEQIALIPHVIWEGNDDRVPLNNLYEKYKSTGRVLLVEDKSAPELKYIISNCSLFIGARTHATIAAYSSCVPTLVVGYSVKSRGIATDLFGTDKNYVIPVQALKNPTDLSEAFKWTYEHAKEQKQLLSTTIPEYITRVNAINDILK